MWSFFLLFYVSAYPWISKMADYVLLTIEISREINNIWRKCKRLLYTISQRSFHQENKMMSNRRGYYCILQLNIMQFTGYSCHSGYLPNFAFELGWYMLNYPGQTSHLVCVLFLTHHKHQLDFESWKHEHQCEQL